MTRERRSVIALTWLAATVALVALLGPSRPVAQSAQPQMLDPALTVETVVAGLTTPIGMAFIDDGDMLVIEKDTGRVLRVQNGVVTATALDLGVNNQSERGLLGIAPHPRFPDEPFVFLFWTCRTAGAPANPFFPDDRACLDTNMFLPDTSEILQVPLLGNRVDRFRWNGSTLAFDQNLIMLRAFQNDAAPIPAGQGDEAQPPRANHNGGVIRFGPDGTLYIQMGDNGRRGQLQNLTDGPGGPTRDDDQFGGPEPDDAHLTGVILRLNDDGSAPTDNPFYRVGARMGGEVGANLQKVYAYGLRNGFGMAFDPYTGHLWEQENGDDSFSELNRVDPGFNSGWVQIMGPPGRLDQFKSIETTVTPNPPDPFAMTYFGLQQLRWSPENIADTQGAARGRLFNLPGSHYSEPEFSWKYEVAPGGIGFVKGNGLGPRFDGHLFMAAARPFLQGGHLFHFALSPSGRSVATTDPRLRDGVADNLHKWEITESESLLIGRNFGIGTDVQTGPNGHLYIVSLSNGAVYEISAVEQD
ncbi:MAG TPA: PQQ-dependent sugar dehydrogenase [Vicinamibacterales bacterium]|nr:PQQ-dependent sugar dehydrogenase [Vicinamibacterales bacterium]